MRRLQKMQLMAFAALFIPLMMYQLNEGLSYGHSPLNTNTARALQNPQDNESSTKKVTAKTAKWSEVLQNIEKDLLLKTMQRDTSMSTDNQNANKPYNKGNFNQNKGKFNQTKGNFNKNKGKFNGTKGGFFKNKGKFNGTKGNFFKNKGKFNGTKGKFKPQFNKGNHTKFVRKKWSPPPKPTTPRPRNPWENATSLDLPDLKKCTDNENQWKEQGDTLHQLEWPCARWQKEEFHNRNWPYVFEPSRGKNLQGIDVDAFEDEVRDLVAEQMEVQQQRVNQLADTCEANPELAVRQHLNLVWATKNDPPVVYCPIYKVASTTWMAYFLRLAHINDELPGLENLSENEKEKKRFMPKYGGGHRRVFQEYHAPDTSVGKKKTYTKAIKFIVVRHPFARLLSAYRDKIERPNPKPFTPYFQQLQKAIMIKYRPTNSNLTNDTPTLSEFVDYVIDSTKDFTTAKQWSEHVVCWTPFWVQCGVCSYDYQMVVKLETMQDDEQFLFQIANLKELQNVHEWRNVKGKKSSSAVVPDYFKSLTKTQVQLLYEVYELDFVMFGYDIKDY
ncbi:unnamed protein product, partial [Meganyctiphanes norvegica]